MQQPKQDQTLDSTQTSASDTETQVAQATETPAEPSEAVAENSPEALAARIADLEAQLEDSAKYHQADLQNLHRRHQEEIQTTHKFATRKFAEELLNVKDYLEMALLDQSGNFDALKMGVNMTLTELNRAFSSAQIQEIIPEVGSPLDPHRHQAIQAIESEQTPNTIVSIAKKGYLLHDRVLRPATVVVAKGKEDKPDSKA